MYHLISTHEYRSWFESQNVKTQGQIMARLERIEEYGHFGITNFLGDSLAELKWKNGTRVYFIILRPRKDKTILVLLGGNKNSQVSDIRRARKLIIKYVSEE